MKDAQGRFLWTQSLAAGQPNMLLGYPVQIVEGLPGIAPNAFPIGFGNWNRAYLLIDIATPRITRDEVTQPGFVKFYVRRRVGGCVLNNHAAKFLKPVTS
jgi:HK97 family phage major capsid protein